MKTSIAKAATLFLGVACATFFLLESLAQAEEARSASQGSTPRETIEVPPALRDDVKKAFEASEQLLGRERTSMETRLQKAMRVEIKELIAQWESMPPARAAIREKVLAELESSRALCNFDFLALITLDNEVILTPNANLGSDGEPRGVSSALLVAAEPFFRDAKAWSGFQVLPADVLPDSVKEGDFRAKTAIYLVSGLTSWVRPDAPAAVLMGGISLHTFSRAAAAAFPAAAGKLRWHAFLDEPEAGTRVIAGSSLGSRVSRAFFQALVHDGSTEEPAFEGERHAPGRWRAIYGRLDEVLGGWGVTVDPASLKRVAPVAVAGQVDLWEPMFTHLERQWIYYAAAAGGLFALFLLSLSIRWLRRDRAPVRVRRVPPAEHASPIVAPLPKAPPVPESLVSQFELNWKTFASFTQDMLQQKLREIEDAPVRGVKDVREQVGKLNQALAELKADLAAARSEAKDTTVGVVEKVATIVAEESREKRSKPDEEAVLRRIESDFDRAANRFTQLDETVGQLAGMLGEKRNAEIEARVKEEVGRLEAQWDTKISEFGIELEGAKKQGKTLLDELDKARAVEVALRQEIDKAAANAAELNRKLEESRFEIDAVSKEREIAWRREREAQESLLGSRAREDEALAKVIELTEARNKAQAAAREAELRQESAQRDALKASADADRVRTEILQAQREGQEAHAQLSRKEKEFDEERSKLSERVKTLNGLVSELNRQSSETHAEGERLRGLLASRDEELASNAKSSVLLKEERARIEIESARLKELVTQLELDLKQEHHTLANTQQALEMHKIEVEELTARLSRAEKEGERLHAAVDAERAEVHRVRTESDARERQIKPEKEALEKALEASLSETKRLRAGEEEVSRLRSQLAEAESRMRTRPEPRDSGARVDVAQLQASEKERKELLESIDRLGKELEKARTEADGIRCFQGTLVDGCIPAAIVAFDTSLKVFAWNSKAESLWDKSPPSAIGRQLVDLGLKGIERDAASFAHRALKEKRSVSLPQSSFTDGKGKVRHVRLSCDPIVGPRGEVLGGVLVGEEITERVEHEIEARLQALFSQSLAKSLPGALVVIDTQHRVISWNRNAESIFGVSEKRALGESFFALETPLAKETFRRHFEAVSKDRMPHRVRVKFELGGIPTQFVVTQAPFLGSDDAIRGTILLIQEANEPVEAARGLR